jgi:hypothetical protein
LPLRGKPDLRRASSVQIGVISKDTEQSKMTVVNPSSRGNRRKSSRARPDFAPSKSTGLYLRFDCVAGRAKIAGHPSGELFSRKCRFNIDIAKVEAGYIDFQANAESSIVGTDRDNPPPGAGERDGPKWGVEVPIAMPYSTVFDDVEIKEVPPCLLKTSTALLLEALGSLWDAYDEDTRRKDGDVACCEVAGWEAVSKAGGKKYFRPRFKILGYVVRLEDRFVGGDADDDDHE